MTLKCFSALLFSSLVFGANGSCIGDQNTKASPYSFYVVPQLAVSETYLAWTPVLDQIGKRLNVCFDLKVPSGIPLFERDLIEGKPDFAFMNPYHLLPAKTSHGYIPIIADGENKLSGIIVVRKDSGIRSLKELDGAKLAFPAPNSMAASLLIRITLDQRNIQITPEYVKTHGNVYRSVALGDYIAGGGVNYTFQRESPALKNELRVLFETQKITPHPVAVHPRVSAQIRQAVARIFIELGKDSRMKNKLDQIQIPRPIAVNYERDYQNLERIGLEKFLEKRSD